jgi:hypothetical protein
MSRATEDYSGSSVIRPMTLERRYSTIGQDDHRHGDRVIGRNLAAEAEVSLSAN